MKGAFVTFAGDAAHRAGTDITLTTGEETLKATLKDNATTRDLLTLLPLTLSLEDHASTQTIAYLPRTLSARCAPAGSTPNIGALASSAPWGNLALFHRPSTYSSGLIVLGKLEGDPSVLRPGTVIVRTERVRT